MASLGTPGGEVEECASDCQRQQDRSHEPHKLKPSAARPAARTTLKILNKLMPRGTLLRGRGGTGKGKHTFRLISTIYEIKVKGSRQQCPLYTSKAMDLCAK
jgi:hypothetical protein